MPQKKKTLTFSFDDGVTQDIRLIELLNKYGLKATFNINSGLLGNKNELIREGKTVNHTKINTEDVKYVYEGHEIASHTLTHPNLTGVCDEKEIIRQVEEDRIRLSELAGYEVIGFAYPGGGINFNGKIADIIENSTNVKYARTTVTTDAFSLPENPFILNPTVKFTDIEKTELLFEKFLDMPDDVPAMFYIWGHSYELDIHNTWERFEEVCKFISGNKNIFYGTNKECLSL